MLKQLALISFLTLAGCATPVVKSTVINADAPTLTVPAPAPLNLNHVQFGTITSNKNVLYTIDANGMAQLNINYHEFLNYIKAQQAEISAYKAYYAPDVSLKKSN